MENGIGKVRISELGIKNFKCVASGRLIFNVNGKYDATGIIGPNATGKTAAVEALDVMRHIMAGVSVPYGPYAALLSDDAGNPTELDGTFLIYDDAHGEYEVRYACTLHPADLVGKSDANVIAVSDESLRFSDPAGPKTKRRKLHFENPCYADNFFIPNPDGSQPRLEVIAEPGVFSRHTGIPRAMSSQLARLAISCACSGTSLFFGKGLSMLQAKREADVDPAFSFILTALRDFGKRVMHVETREVGREMARLYDGTLEVREADYPVVENYVNRMIYPLPNIFPGMRMELRVLDRLLNRNGETVLRLGLFSVGGGRELPMSAEPYGVRRLISYLPWVVDVVNDRNCCLIVDDMDADLYDKRFYGLLKGLSESARGQVILTAHCADIVEELTSAAICTSTDRNDRYRDSERYSDFRDYSIARKYM